MKKVLEKAFDRRRDSIDSSGRMRNIPLIHGSRATRILKTREAETEKLVVRSGFKREREKDATV